MHKPSSYQARARLRLSRDPAFYRKFVVGFKRSGLSLSEYCAKHRVGENTFRKYQSRQSHALGGSMHPSDGTAPTLIPVLAAIPESESPIEFILPGGTRIRLSALDASHLLLLRPLLTGQPS